tara:strand:- start:3875 stop:5248 length:1374 start_codon:yes stop_codon:yes gene_type:complete
MLEKEAYDKCGVMGIFNVQNPAGNLYLGLHNIQHRGQGGCGIMTASKRKIHSAYGKGIVNDAFSKSTLKKLKGRSGIGHVIYPTVGFSSTNNKQPIVGETNNGIVGVAHNGQILNYERLRKELKKGGSDFKTKSDTEVILKKFAKAKGNSLEEILFYTFKDIRPSYSIVMLTKNELIGIKDPSGVRPLAIGYIIDKNAYVLASESVAFDIIGAKHIGEVERGEAVIIDDKGLRRKQLFNKEKEQKCIFESIYFSRPDSMIYGDQITTSIIRKEFGKQLYRESPTKADIVIPVPDSSIDAALGYSYESGIPFDWGFVRNHYIGRTFIQPTQTIIDADIMKKLNVNKSVVDKKKVIIVDDSIVRSSTIKKIIRLIKDGGAKEVHVKVSSPPYKHSCNLGIETSKKERLIANEKSIEEIKDFICADSLHYLSKNGMLNNKYLDGEFCTYCFDGEEVIKRE